MMTDHIASLQGRTVAEFFAGIGLMRLGLEKAGWKVVFANDISEQKRAMYEFHFKDTKGHFLLGDIHKLDGNSIPSVALATASFPCNDLSLAGMRLGLSGRQSSAYWGFIKLLEGMRNRRPPLVLLENVAGFLTSHNGQDFRSALVALNRLGYIVDPFMIDATHFVPQSRVRLFVLASFQNGQEFYGVKKPRGFYESELRTKKLADFIFLNPDILWNIRDLPTLPNRKAGLTGIIEDLPDNSFYWWDRPRVEYLINQMSDKHKQQLIHMKFKRGWSYGTIFRRVRKLGSMAELRNDGIAGCLRTPRGGSGRQILLVAGYDQVKARLLTPRECARLQGADEFLINASLNNALFGFGDAVCVPVIEWIALNYLNPLWKELLAIKKKRNPRALDYSEEASIAK